MSQRASAGFGLVDTRVYPSGGSQQPPPPSIQLKFDPNVCLIFTCLLAEKGNRLTSSFSGREQELIRKVAAAVLSPMLAKQWTFFAHHITAKYWLFQYYSAPHAGITVNVLQLHTVCWQYRDSCFTPTAVNTAVAVVILHRQENTGCFYKYSSCCQYSDYCFSAHAIKTVVSYSRFWQCSDSSSTVFPGPYSSADTVIIVVLHTVKPLLLFYSTQQTAWLFLTPYEPVVIVPLTLTC